MLLPERKETFRHEAQTHRWLSHYLISTHRWERRTANCIGQALHGHHGNFHSASEVDFDDPRARIEYWDQIRNEIAQAVADTLKFTPWAAARFAHSSATGARFAGLVVLADWIASNETLYQSARFAGEQDPAVYLEATRRIAIDVVRQLGFSDQPCAVSATRFPSFIDLWPACLTLRPTQQALDALCAADPPQPGLAIIEAPMGEGKTEAAIYLASVWKQMTDCVGTYIALPTAATSNQMHDRYTAFLQNHHPDSLQPRLVHGMSWLIDDSTPETSQEDVEY